MKALPKPLWYYRNLAAADPDIGWTEIPDCPMERFTRIIESRAREHPEKKQTSIEFRARVFSEAAWSSQKIAQIEPPEWRGEYAWLYPIALVDGTFEADARRLWAAAYATIRTDWDAAKVVLLLDEFERVGLLRRAKDENGRTWGYWVGSDKFGPTKASIKKARYKTGRLDLFFSPEQLAA